MMTELTKNLDALMTKVNEAKVEERCGIAEHLVDALSLILDQFEERTEHEYSKENTDSLDNDLDLLETFYDTATARILSLFETATFLKLMNKLEQDYKMSIETLEYFNILDSSGVSYEGDYEDFEGITFAIPSFSEIKARLTPKQIELYQSMQRMNLRPTLQITPIALKLRTLADKINSKKIKIKGYNTAISVSVDDDVDDKELIYDPEKVELDDNENILIKGGKSKEEWIAENKGVLVDIVPMTPEIPPVRELELNEDGSETSFGYMATITVSLQKDLGYSPMSYESHLVAQMAKLKNDDIIDDNYGLGMPLLDSNFESSGHYSECHWETHNELAISKFSANHVGGEIGVRCTVRVKGPEQ